MKIENGKIERILVRAVNWVGDTILSFPAVQRLKMHFSRSHLAVLVRQDLADLWKMFPYVDEVIAFQQRRGWSGLNGDLALGLSLRKKNFDLAVIFPRSFRSAFQIYLARIPVRLGYRDEGRSLFLTDGVSRPYEILRVHRILYYQRLVNAFGEGEKWHPPKIFLAEDVRAWAERELKQWGLLDGRPLIGMNPGATYGVAKCWYPERFEELGRRLVQKWKASVLLFGKYEERAVNQEILSRLGRGAIDLAGKTSLPQLAAMLEKCDLLITNDTGTMHVATAVNTPVVAIFGPTDPVATGPWGEGHVVVRREGVSCSPCFKRICPTDHRCMKGITVDEMEQTVDRRLRSGRND